MRPKQWAKNALVFAAYLFTAGWTQPEATLRVVLAFVALCGVSSASYALNDVLDAPRDRLHPRKRRRPVAAGEVRPGAALALAAACLVGGLFVAAAISLPTAGAVAAFALIQALYNAVGRRVPIGDVMLISLAFVARAVVGAVAIEVEVSGWLLFCTGALALLLGLAKRRHENRSLEDGGEHHRPGLASYTPAALDALVVFAASMACLSYGVYALESPTAQRHPGVIWTTPLVVYGVMRYLWLVFARDEGGEPETTVLHDAHMLATLLLFGLLAALAVSDRLSASLLLSSGR